MNCSIPISMDSLAIHPFVLRIAGFGATRFALSSVTVSSRPIPNHWEGCQIPGLAHNPVVGLRELLQDSDEKTDNLFMTEYKWE